MDEGKGDGGKADHDSQGANVRRPGRGQHKSNSLGLVLCQSTSASWAAPLTISKTF